MSSSTVKLLERINRGNIAFNEWNIGNAKSAPVSDLAKLAKLVKMLDATGTNEKKKTRVLTSEDYLTLSNELTISLPKVKKSGPVELLEPKTPGSYVLVSRRIVDDLKGTTLAPGFDISKSKYKSMFTVSIGGNLCEESTIELLRAIDKKASDFVDQVNKLPINNERTTFFKLGFKGIFPEANSNIFPLSFVMNKVKKEDPITHEPKFELDGYPKYGIRDLSRRTRVTVGGSSKLIPRAFSKAELHESKLHLLFGTGTTIQASFRIDWSLSESNLRLRVKVCDECLIKPCVVNPELVTVQRLVDKFGNDEDADYKETDEEGNVINADDSSEDNLEDADKRALAALHHEKSDDDL